MSGVAGMEYHKDIAGSGLYASRNFNNLRHAYQAPGANRTQVDWALTLRQVRKPVPLTSSASAPTLGESMSRRSEPLAPEHPEGSYHGEGPTVGRYQNYAATNHLVKGGTRPVGVGASHTINWALNLRDGLHKNEHSPQQGWRRHYARSFQSFDMMAENVAAEAYNRSQITPQDRRPDRRSGAISIETIRDDPISFKRYPGCEGTEVNQWRHLVEDKRYGHKIRQHVRYETTLRENPRDSNGARITDNRSSGCVVEMLGKKRHQGATHHEPLAQSLPYGDPKLTHNYWRRPLPERDEEDRQRRMARAPRTDANISEAHQSRSHRMTLIREDE